MASASPLSEVALATRSAASHDTGGVISAVMTKRSDGKLVFQGLHRIVVLQFLPRFKAARMGRTSPNAHLARPRPTHKSHDAGHRPLARRALAPITDGCVLAVPRESTGVAMAATRALIRRGVKRLTLVALPTSSLQADLLIGAGCVETLETSAVSLGEFGAGAALHRRDHRRAPSA